MSNNIQQEYSSVEEIFIPKVIKRSGKLEEFSAKKVEKAILHAMRTGSGVYKKALAELIASEISDKFLKKKSDFKVQEIDDYVQKSLNEYGQTLTSQAYTKFRALKDYRNQDNEIINTVSSIVNQSNKELLEENANKNFKSFSTQRDLIAGEVAKLISRHIIPEDLYLAHQEGIIHIHDLDYFSGFNEKQCVQSGSFNCCLVDLKGMLEEGTVINNKKISDINSINKAATIASQISLGISGAQYGGQTMSLSHLAPFVRKSKDRWLKLVAEDQSLTEDQIDVLATRLLKKEIVDGIKTLNYQLNTFNSSNGQTPFISLFMYINEDKDYVEETAMLVEEVLKQRIEGLPNRYGYATVQTFPKLLYVLDDNNITEDSKYWHITKLAAESISKTMAPDLISAKVMKAKYEEKSEKTGEVLHDGVFPCMGCRSFLSKWIDPKTNTPKYYGRYNKGVQSINLPDVALSSGGDIDVFWQVLDERLELIKRVGEGRYGSLKYNADNLEGSPLHWKYGAISRLEDGGSFEHTLVGGYSTISLGFIGIYEMCIAMFGKSHTSPEAKEFALKVLNHMSDKAKLWNEELDLGWSLYATPSEGYCETSYKKTKKRFGEVDGVTDHGFFTNSYHVYVGEEIDVFSKLDFEAEFQDLCTGGCISYAEIGNLVGNQEAIIEVMKHIYDHIQYAELNTECDRCNSCGSNNPLKQDESDDFFCPECGSYNVEAVRRICGYLGVASNGINAGKRREMAERVKHI